MLNTDSTNNTRTSTTLIFQLIGGMLLSLAIQFNSKINLETGSFGKVFQENAPRFLISAALGALVFFGLHNAFKYIRNTKWQEVAQQSLLAFNVFIFYFLFQGKDIALFNHLAISILFFIICKSISSSFGNAFFQSQDNKNAVWTILIIGYFPISILLYADELSLYSGFQSLLSLSFGVLPLYFIPRGKRLYVLLLIGVNFIYTLPELYHIYMYGSKMPVSVYYVMIEAPSAERMEYLSSYFTWKIGGLILAYLTLPLAGIFLIKKNTFSLQQLNTSGFLFIALLSTWFFVDKDNFKNNIYYGYIKNYQDYVSKIEKFNLEMNLRKNKQVRFAGIHDENKTSSGKTFVLIIGESTGRRHMQLYDYFRPTNPKLASISKELVIFNDVISPHSHTMPSLEKVLTLANFDNMDPLYKEGSIIELFKQANYKTYWLSNQFFFDEFGSSVTSIAKECDYHLFINDDEDVTKTKSFDGKLLKPLNLILNKTNENKLIVLHLLGTHGDYLNRFPENATYFKAEDRNKIPTKNKPFLKESEYGKQVINDYDNAVRYNDEVVYNIIQSVKAKSNYAYVMYFSDHGEEVYDSRQYFSHQESDATTFMFDIPFIIWCSEGYKKENAKKVDYLSHQTNRAYQTDDVIHSILDLSNIKAKRWNPEKSIFNTQYKTEKRSMNNQDYDSIKKDFEIYHQAILKKKKK